MCNYLQTIGPNLDFKYNFKIDFAKKITEAIKLVKRVKIRILRKIYGKRKKKIWFFPITP